MNFKRLKGYPKDGIYLWRMDAGDDEPATFEVIKGKAFKDGKRNFVAGGEWAKKKDK